jgi:hypothetical protein
VALAPDGNGGYRLQDASGTTRFHVPAPTAVDAQGHTGAVRLTLTRDAAVLALDPAFLARAAYPVTVDPTVNWTLAAAATRFEYDAHAPAS